MNLISVSRWKPLKETELGRQMKREEKARYLRERRNTKSMRPHKSKMIYCKFCKYEINEHHLDRHKRSKTHVEAVVNKRSNEKNNK
jgi:hypothetical protein